MRDIALTAVPAQTITVQLDGDRFSLAVKTAAGVTIVDVSRNGEPVVTGARALAGEPVIPYAYRETGNFMFLTVDDALPAWSEFGVSQSLVYISRDEVAALK